MRMLTYFINRAGRGLSAARKAELEKAKALLSKRIEREKKSPAKSGVMGSYRAGQANDGLEGIAINRGDAKCG